METQVKNDRQVRRVRQRNNNRSALYRSDTGPPVRSASPPEGGRSALIALVLLGLVTAGACSTYVVLSIGELMG